MKQEILEIHTDDERDNPDYRAAKRQEARDLIQEIRDLAASVRKAADQNHLGYPLKNAVQRERVTR